MKHELVYSALVTPDGTLLESLHRLDYREHFDKNKKKYYLNGGLDFAIASNWGDEKFIRVYADEDYERVRQYAFRICRGEDGNRGPFVRVILAKLTDIHLESVIRHLTDVLRDDDQKSNTHYRLLKLEKAYRQSKQIWTL